MLADDVLPLIRTRADLHRWSAANAHGAQMHEAVDLLEAAHADPGCDPAQVWSVTHRALASALKVIGRADDSSGIIGDACRRLLRLHPQAALAAAVKPATLVEWLMEFQFGGGTGNGYFEVDPVAYAPALGEAGMLAYRARLRDVEERLAGDPDTARWGNFTVEWNARRLAVLDRDVEAIIRTHARDCTVVAWLEDTARAFEEIGEIDLAIDWARRAAEGPQRHQAIGAARYWCELLAEHRPSELPAARLAVFRRHPSSSSAAELYRVVGEDWPQYRDEVTAELTRHPRHAVLFALLTLKDPEQAWELAHRLGVADQDVWSELLKSYDSIDPAAALPVHARLVEAQLVDADARGYRSAARRLAAMRKLAAGCDQVSMVDDLVAELRVAHRRRPRLQQEFNRAGLP